MTSPHAILIGSAIIAAGIVGSRLLPPYRLVHTEASGVWRFNVVTGEGYLCLPKKDADGHLLLNCDFSK